MRSVGCRNYFGQVLIVHWVNGIRQTGMRTGEAVVCVQIEIKLWIK
jgi:hypothetical protein